MRNIFLYTLLILVVCAALLPSCKKGDLIAGKTNGALTAELLNLPNTPAMEVYFKGVKLDSLLPGTSVGLSPKIIVPAGDSGTLSFKRKGTEEVLIDTVIAVPAEAELNFRLAYSEDLGIKTFLAGGSSVSADSCRIQFFDQLTTTLQPDEADVDLCGFRYNTNTMDYTQLYVFPSLVKGQLHPMSITLPVAEPDGSNTGIQYSVKLKDRATGNFLTDQWPQDIIPITLYGGATVICVLKERTLRGKIRFGAESITL